jgi:UDP:flavonoid glycosyltransferase YjiC (YdhE family)
MHVILVTVGSSGDVHPFVGLGIALRKRGHRVTLVTGGYFEQLARDAGLEFVDFAPEIDYRELINDPRIWNRFRGFQVVMQQGVIPALRSTYQAIAERYVLGETVVAASSLALGAVVAREKLGVPLATVHLSPSIFRSYVQSPKLPGTFLPDWLPTPLKRFQYWVADRAIIDRLLGPALNGLRAELGLPPVRGIMADWWNSPDRVLGFFPQWFGPQQPDWPKQTRLVGFPLYDERNVVEPAAEVEQFLAAGEPPIVFTPGSANVFGHGFFAAAVEACRLLNRRGLLLTRFPEQIPRELPDGVRHFDFVPFGWLLPRAAAIVHHGGIGSLAQGLAAGVPQLVMPMNFDQFDNVARIEQLGVGHGLVPRKFRGPAVARSLASLIDSPDVAARCRLVSELFHKQDALTEACLAIEELAAERAPAPSPSQLLS